MVLTTLTQTTRYAKEDDGRESIWTFPRRWRVRFFVIFYTLVVFSTVWGTYETVVSRAPTELSYRSFIAVYVQSIAGAVVTSMLIVGLMRSIKMLSNAIEDWLIEKRKKRDAYWRAVEDERVAREKRQEAELRALQVKLETERRARQAEIDAERLERERKMRTEAVEYGRLVATCEARGEVPPPPPWQSNGN